jgi:hypothetical protein
MGWQDAPLAKTSRGWKDAPLADAPKPRDTSAVRGLALGAVKPLDNLVSAARAAAPGLVGALDDAGAAIGLPRSDAAVRANDAARANNTRTGFQTAGNVIGTAPTMALPGGALVQGAAGGALLSDAQDGFGLVKDATVGAVGGKVADVALGAAAKAAAPKVNDYVRLLTKEGVKMTPGQIVGGTFKRIEDAATSIPFVGDAIKGAQRRSIETFNRAAINRSLAPIGQKLDEAIGVGNEAIAAAGDKLSAAYRSILPSLKSKIDPTFVTRVQAVQAGASLPAPQAARFNEVLQNDVARAFDPKTGVASGRALKVLDEKLGDMAAGYRASPDPDLRALGVAVSDLRQQVLGLVRRNNPASAAELRKINTGWANLVRVERAAAQSADGVFSPNQFNTAVRVADRSGRKRAVARGEALGQDLARAGAKTLPSSVADSGTAGRLVTAGAAGYGLSAGVSPYVLAPAAAAAAAYSRPVAGAIQNVLTRTPGPQSQYVAGLINRSRAPISVAVPALLARPSGD